MSDLEKQNDIKGFAAEGVVQQIPPTHPPPGWPPAPESLEKKGFIRYVGKIADFACIAAGLPFLVLAGVAANLNDRPASDRQWYYVYGAMNAAVSIFPIVFAANVGRAVRALATLRLERGTTLGFIEQLMGSMSLMGALQSQWLLRSFNIMGAVLVALAILSPLGGQSSLQMLRRDMKPIASSPTAAYLDTNKGSNTQFDSGTYYTYALAPMNALLMASLMAPESVKASPRDLWGHAKIPILSQLGSSPASGDGWTEIPMNNISYASLIGVPIVDIPKVANTTFTMETSYMDLDCYEIVPVINGTAKGISLNPNKTYTDTSLDPQKGAPADGTFWGPPQVIPCLYIDGFMGPNYGPVWQYEKNTTTDFPQRTVTFKYISPLKPPVMPLCRIVSAYVEVAVKCADTRCEVARMRPSKQPHPDPKLIPLEFVTTFMDFVRSLQQATSNSQSQSSSITEFYLRNPLDPLTNSYREFADLAILTKAEWTIRLGQVINSYYMASLSPWGLMSSTPLADTPSYPGGGNITLTVSSTTNQLTYFCRWGWWVVFVLSTLIMMATASVAAFFRWRSVAPDILGFVSSMARDSPFINLPPGGSTLDGTSRTCILKDHRVGLQDVQKGQDTGRLALVSLEGEPTPIDAQRRYA